LVCDHWQFNAGVVAFLIIVACGATLNKRGIQINEAQGATLVLKPIERAFNICFYKKTITLLTEDSIYGLF
jgi:hypothetical protein